MNECGRDEAIVMINCNNTYRSNMGIWFKVGTVLLVEEYKFILQSYVSIYM